MAKAKNTDNLATLQMALVGYALEKEEIERKIREINSLLGGKGVKHASSKATAKPHARREMNAVARKRIAAAQRKRWEEYRKQKAQAT